MSLRPAGHADTLRCLLKGVELLHSTAPESEAQLRALLHAERSEEVGGPARVKAGFQNLQKKRKVGKADGSEGRGRAASVTAGPALVVAARRASPVEPPPTLGPRGKGVAKKQKGKGGSRLDSLRQR